MRDDGLRRANPVEKPQNFMETNVIYGILRIMLPVSALAGALFVADENAQAQTPARLPLVTFHSAARGDYFTTSQPGWTCKYFKDCPGPLDADYVVVGLQGEVYNPALPQPPGTLTLYHWFSWERMDNFLTTDPGWAGTVGAVKDIGGGVRYGLFRIEGYIDPPGLPATLPLRSYWNPAEGDNAAVTAWRPDQPAGYGEYRYEGNLLTPDSPDLVRCRTNAAPSSSSAYFSRANYVEVWRSPVGLIHGDVFRATAPQEEYTIDYWGNRYPTRGYYWMSAAGGYPAPGVPPYALLGVIGAGRLFVDGQGWFEPEQWFKLLGDRLADPGPCVLYDATNVVPTPLKTAFNDPNLSDNSGGAHLTFRQWF